MPYLRMIYLLSVVSGMWGTVSRLNPNNLQRQSGYDIRLFLFVVTCDIPNQKSTQSQQKTNFYTIYYSLSQKLRGFDSMVRLSVLCEMGNRHTTLRRSVVIGEKPDGKKEWSTEKTSKFVILFVYSS